MFNERYLHKAQAMLKKIIDDANLKVRNISTVPDAEEFFSQLESIKEAKKLIDYVSESLYENSENIACIGKC